MDNGAVFKLITRRVHMGVGTVSINQGPLQTVPMTKTGMLSPNWDKGPVPLSLYNS
jgi:hypothetical protein